MTLEGAINFNETDSYIIYTMNSATTGQYCVVLPKGANGVMNMLVDLHMKSLFDGVVSGAKTKEQLVDEVGKEYTNVVIKYNHAILVCPMMDEGMFHNAVINNDKQKMFDEVKKIGAITSEIYRKLTASGVDKQNIDQKIIIIEKDNHDVNFVAWLKEQMPNFVEGVLYSDLEPKEVPNVNPFMENNSIFPSNEVKVEPVVDSVSTGNSIFDAPVSSTSVQPNVESVSSVAEPVIPTPGVDNHSFDIFGTSNTPQQVASTVANVVSDVQPAVVSSEPVFATSEVTSVNNPTAQTPVMDIPQPQPVNNVNLEGTTTFSPLPNSSSSESVSVESAVSGEMVETGKKSGGFVNLIILVVILIGVTIASIELGKFLYSVYGA